MKKLTNTFILLLFLLPSLIRAQLDTVELAETNVDLVPLYDIGESQLNGFHSICTKEIPGLPLHFLVLTQEGQFFSLFPEGEDYKSELLVDFTERTSFSLQRETGGWAFEFHPDFPAKPLLYMIYLNNADTGTGGEWEEIEYKPKGVVMLEEWKVQGEKSTQLSLNRQILDYPHTAGFGVSNLTFGADDMLYISLMDYRRSSHDLTTWGRKVLRIDINRADPGLQYGIPQDNPFYESTQPRLKKEIYANGFRNIWNLEADRKNNILWAGDVGQGGWEELNRILPGKNYGWDQGGDGAGKANFFEGPCDPEDGWDCSQFQDPEIPFRRGSNSKINYNGMSCITVGPVYRGDPASPWKEHVVLADVGTGNSMYLYRPGERMKYLGNFTHIVGRSNHGGICQIFTDSYGSVYGTFIERKPNRYFAHYKLVHANLQGKLDPTTALVERGLQPAKPKMGVNLGLLSVPLGRETYRMDGSRIPSLDRVPAGLYFQVPESSRKLEQ